MSKKWYFCKNCHKSEIAICSTRPDTPDPTKPENPKSKNYKFENLSDVFGIQISNLKPDKPEHEKSEPDKFDLCSPLGP